MPHLQTVIEHYTPLVMQDAPGYQVLDWSSRESQFLRFEILALEIRQYLGKAPFRLLDVGCGLAELYGYHKAQDFPVEYTGVDLTPAILAEARRRNPELDLREVDVFATPQPFPDHSFDVVFCSGVFNLRQDNSLVFAQQGLAKLTALASRLAAVNFLHSRTAEQYSECCYFAPEELLDYAKRADTTVTVRDDYLDKDFTIFAHYS